MAFEPVLHTTLADLGLLSGQSMRCVDIANAAH